MALTTRGLVRPGRAGRQRPRPGGGGYVLCWRQGRDPQHFPAHIVVLPVILSWIYVLVVVSIVLSTVCLPPYTMPAMQLLHLYDLLP
ncbi:hypothetical protein Trydic_g23777 [Trypoxylus dichotomus]